MPESDEPDIRPEDALQVAQRALVRIQDLEARLDDAVHLAKHSRDRVDELEDRVAELEALLEDTDTETADYDDRDAAVVEHLEPGKSVKVTDLHRLYRRHTDIRADDTLKQRVQGLVAGPDFRIGGVGEIIYDPDGGEQR